MLRWAKPPTANRQPSTHLRQCFGGQSRQSLTVNRQPTFANASMGKAVNGQNLTWTNNRKVVHLSAFRPYLTDRSPETKKLQELMPGKALRHRL